MLFIAFICLFSAATDASLINSHEWNEYKVNETLNTGLEKIIRKF